MYGGDREFCRVNASVMQSGYWRVKIAWPTTTPRYFGKFKSQAEAQQWIEQHRWLTDQAQEPHET
jgi:hypothetical protein